MPVYQITRDVMERIATAVSRSFHSDALFSEVPATSGQPESLVIRNPVGPDTPYVSLLFPASVLDRIEPLGPKQFALVGERIRNVLAVRLTEYQRELDAGSLKTFDPFPIEYDDRLLDGI